MTEGGHYSLVNNVPLDIFGGTLYTMALYHDTKAVVDTIVYVKAVTAKVMWYNTKYIVRRCVYDPR